MSSTHSEPAAKGDRYHHGDLKAALVDGAIELIAERGVRGFSLAELSRRLGVTVAAPYRHFADRDELMAAIAVRALDAFAAAVEAAVRQAEDGPAELRVAAVMRTYVEFAAAERPLFEVVYGMGLDKHRYPDLRQALTRIDDIVGVHVRALFPADEPAESAKALLDPLEATAHGYAVLLLDGSYGTGPEAVSEVADRVAAATLALIKGRSALTTPSPPAAPR